VLHRIALLAVAAPRRVIVVASLIMKELTGRRRGRIALDVSTAVQLFSTRPARRGRYRAVSAISMICCAKRLHVRCCKPATGYCSNAHIEL
jgi:hypothetical protein